MNFGVVGGMKVEGNIFADLDGDGKQDDGEPSITTAQAYLDANNNGRQDKHEQGVLTDAEG